MERQVVDAVKECETMMRAAIVEANELIDRLNEAMGELRNVNTWQDADAYAAKYDTMTDDFEYVKLV